MMSRVFWTTKKEAKQMSKPSSGPTDRNFGLDHINGKGDKTRVTNVIAYRENFDGIDWTSTKKKVYLTLQELHDEWEFRHGL